MNAADAAPLTPPPEYATGQISGAWQPPRRTSRRKTSFLQRRFCEKYLTVPLHSIIISYRGGRITPVAPIHYLASRLLLRSSSSASSPRSPSTSSLSLLSISSKVLSSLSHAVFTLSSSSCGNGFCTSTLAFSI